MTKVVDIYLDVTDTLLAVTSATGTLAASLTIPASAQPGVHYITAIGRKSGDTVQTAFTVSTSRAMSGFGAAQLSWNPCENTLSPSVVPSLGLLWSTSVGAAGGISVAGGRIFVEGGPGVVALSAQTGSVLWTANTGPPGNEFTTPAVSGNTVYIGGPAGFYALNASNGKTLWLNPIGQGSVGLSAFFSAVVANGMFCVANRNSNVYAFSVATGNAVWSHSILNVPAASLTISGGIVFIPGVFEAGFAVFRLEQTTGNDLCILGNLTLQEYPTTITTAAGLAFLTENTFVFASNAFNTPQNTLVWETSNAADSFGYVEATNSTLYVASGNLSAASTADGSLLWTLANAPDGTGFYSPISVADNVLYTGSQIGDLFAFSPTDGTLLWSGALGNGLQAQPAVVNGVLYTVSLDGTVSAFAPNAGTDHVRPRRLPLKPSSLHADLSLSISN